MVKVNQEREVLEYASFIIGLLIAVLLSYFYNIYAPITHFNLETLMIFLTIPSLSGFATGMIAPTKATRNALFVGLISGAISMFMTIYIILTEEIFTTEAYTLFLTIGVFAWMMLSAACGRLAKECRGKQN